MCGDMNALLRDKLHWAFQLYDRDGSGSIDIQEMIKVLCSISSVMRLIDKKQEYKVLNFETSKLKPSTYISKALRLDFSDIHLDRFSGFQIPNCYTFKLDL